MGGTLSSLLYGLKSAGGEECKCTLLWAIFQWDPKWLDNPKYDKQPPPIFNEKRPMIATSLYYKSFEDYYKVMEPLMLLEFFHALKKDSEEVPTEKKKNDFRSSSVTGKITDDTNDNVSTSNERMMKISVEVDLWEPQNNLSRKTDNHPDEGDLVRLKFGNNEEVFGYVSEKVDYSHYLLYDVKIKIQTKRIPAKCNIKLTSVTMMSQYFRIYQALLKFPESTLFHSVLKPKISDYKMSEGEIKKPSSLFPEQKLNPTQMRVVAGILETINDRDNRICLVQGPPGTGKSTVIVNIILQNFVTRRRKILICAPSNKAVDEIVLRLLAIMENPERENLNIQIVRVGRVENMDPKVRKISLFYLSSSSESLSFQFAKLNLSGSEREKRNNKTTMILQEADIIASTLTSCFTKTMERAFSEEKFHSLPICIVDEAGQATEAATLIPLMMGVKKLILVGDPKQLPPTIIAQDAKDRGMDLSLFARAEKNFEGDPKNPIVMLDVQYRMVEPIANWPNKYFYKGKITSAAKVAPLHLHHYRVFNHSFHQTTSKHANWNEASMVLNLLIGIINDCLERKMNPVPSIGVITPYRAQKKIINNLYHCLALKEPENNENKKPEETDPYKLYYDFNLIAIRNQSRFKKKSDTENKENNPKENILHDILQRISINTVDGFQGQERDIIIMSCVRSNGIGFLSDPNRLNVSLTRAKHTMILCGNFKTFRKNPMWQDLLKNAESQKDFIDMNETNIQPKEMMKLVLKKS